VLPPPIAADTATWLGAIGTLLAVLVALAVALFGEQLKRLFWAPKISVSEDIAVFQVWSKALQKHIPHAYVRLRVEVDSSRSSAEGVQIHLVGCEPPAKLGKQGIADQRDFRIPLRWAFSHEPSVDLPPGVSRYADILEIVKGQQESPRVAR
jgi:hypothetical protein